MITLILFLIIIYIDTIEVSYLYLKNHPSFTSFTSFTSFKLERRKKGKRSHQYTIKGMCQYIGIKWYKTLCYDKAIVSLYGFR